MRVVDLPNGIREALIGAAQEIVAEAGRAGRVEVDDYVKGLEAAGSRLYDLIRKAKDAQEQERQRDEDRVMSHAVNELKLDPSIEAHQTRLRNALWRLGKSER